MNAIIYKASLNPMVEVNSTIQIWLIIPDFHQIAIIEDHDTIENLSAKYAFEIVSHNEWDLTRMIKRNCTIILENGLYRFLNYN